jgi:hypothetical protein
MREQVAEFEPVQPDWKAPWQACHSIRLTDKLQGLSS